MENPERNTFNSNEFNIPKRFENPTLIAKGSFSSVYLARDSQLDRQVAMKQILRQSSIRFESEQKAVREIKLLTKLNHPGIIRLLDICKNNHATYLILPFCAKGELDPEKLGQRLTYHLRLSIIDTLLNATSYLHARGWLHNDIKPANLLLGSRDSVFLSDFGEATPVASLNVTSTVIGSVGYIAPELLTGNSGPSIASEIYSIGVTVYEILATQRAFSNDTISALSAANNRRVPLLTNGTPAYKDWNAVIQKATSQVVSDRYTSVRELSDDLQRIRESKTVSARKVSVVENFRRWISREPVTAGLVLSVFLVASFGTIASAFAWKHAAKQAAQSEINEKELERLSHVAVAAKRKLDEAIELATVESEKAKKLEQASSDAILDSIKLRERLQAESAESNRLNAELTVSVDSLQKSRQEQNAVEQKSASLERTIAGKELDIQSIEYFKLINEAKSKIESGQFGEAIVLLNKTIPQLRGAEYFLLRGLGENEWKYPKRTNLGTISFGSQDKSPKYSAFAKDGSVFARCKRSELKILSIQDSNLSVFKLPNFEGSECEIRMKFSDDSTKLVVVRFGSKHCDAIVAEKRTGAGWGIANEPTQIDAAFLGITDSFQNRSFLFCVDRETESLNAKLVDPYTGKTEWTHKYGKPSDDAASLLSFCGLAAGHHVLRLSDRNGFLIVDNGSQLNEFPLSFLSRSYPGEILVVVKGREVMFSNDHVKILQTHVGLSGRRSIPEKDKQFISFPLPVDRVSHYYSSFRMGDELNVYAVALETRSYNKVDKDRYDTTLVRFEYGCKDTAELPRYSTPLTSEESIKFLTSEFSESKNAEITPMISKARQSKAKQLSEADRQYQATVDRFKKIIAGYRERKQGGYVVVAKLRFENEPNIDLSGKIASNFKYLADGRIVGVVARADEPFFIRALGYRIKEVSISEKLPDFDKELQLLDIGEIQLSKTPSDEECSIVGSLITDDASSLEGSVFLLASENRNSPGDASWGESMRLEATVDNSGKFAFRGLSPGSFHLMPAIRGFAEKFDSFNLTANQLLDVGTVRLDRHLIANVSWTWSDALPFKNVDAAHGSVQAGKGWYATSDKSGPSDLRCRIVQGKLFFDCVYAPANYADLGTGELGDFVATTLDQVNTKFGKPSFTQGHVYFVQQLFTKRYILMKVNSVEVFVPLPK